MASIPGIGSISARHSVEERAALERLLASATFSHAPRLQSVLKFLIEAHLEGRTEELNEQSIGQAVFKRSAGYNPADDNIVRVTIRLLRTRLEGFYAAEGREERYILEIPKGKYHPFVRMRTVPAIGAVLEELPATKSVLPTGAPASTRPKFGMAWILVAILLTSTVTLGVLLFRSLAGEQHSKNAGLLQMLVPGENRISIVVTDSNLQAYRDIFQKQVTLGSYIDRSYSQPSLAAVSPALQRAWRYSVEASDTNVTSTVVATSIQNVLSPPVIIKDPHELSMRDLQQGNFVLLGGPWVNPWGQLFESRLNFRIMPKESDPAESWIQNLHPLSGEPADFRPHGEGGLWVDYVRIAVLSNLSNSGHVIVLGATSGDALEAGGRFLINAESLRDLLHRFQVRSAWQLPSFEIVLEVRGAQSIPTSFRIVAQRTVRPMS